VPVTRLLVTGATGFVGGWTVRHWRQRHPDVELWTTSHLPRPEWLRPDRYRRVDLRDEEAARALVEESRPDAVVHLASLIGGADLEAYLSVNVLGTDRLLRALAESAAPGARVVQAGSAAMYGPVAPEDLPIREDHPLRPVTAYAVSKVAQEVVAAAHGRTSSLEIVRARFFNIIGPGQPESLVPMAFVRQLEAARDGRAEKLLTGDTSPERDFVDVRDATAAVDLLLERGRAGEAYNVASGMAVSIQEMIDELVAIAGVDVPQEVEASRLRPVDVPRVVGDASKIAADCGWSPSVPLRRSLTDMWAVADVEPHGATGEDR